jgi:hypothetical protein
MDVPGRATRWARLGVYEAEEWPSGDYSENRRRRRFITYMAMNPQANVGAFVVVTRSPLTRFQQYERWHQRPGQRAERRTAQHADGQPVSPGKVSPMRHNDRFGETSRCHFSYTISFTFHKIRQTMTDLITRPRRLRQSAALRACLKRQH